MAFTLAVGEVAASPFRIMDEFDVFMDGAPALKTKHGTQACQLSSRFANESCVGVSSACALGSMQGRRLFLTVVLWGDGQGCAVEQGCGSCNLAVLAACLRSDGHHLLAANNRQMTMAALFSFAYLNKDMQMVLISPQVCAVVVALLDQ
jgi:hypothetical protein